MNPEKEVIIEAVDIKRSFRSLKKQEGFKGAMEVLFHPQYQVHEALKGVSFKICKGELVGLIGANGAGKTTLLKILSGLIPATSGTARVMGHDPFARSLEFRKKLSLVMGQKAQLWWDLPAVDAFDLLRAIYEVPRDEYKRRLQELTQLLDVEKHLNTQIRRLSLGERMKMELIGALLHWPEVVYLDEPTIGLDVVAAASLRTFLTKYGKSGHSTMIITSHNMDDIESLCSRVLILKDGELVFDGSPQKLVVNNEKQLRVRLSQLPKLEDLSAQVGVAPNKIVVGASEEELNSDRDADFFANTVRFKISNAEMPTVLQKVFSKYQVVDMGVEEQSLEDVIKRLFSGAQL